MSHQAEKDNHRLKTVKTQEYFGNYRVRSSQDAKHIKLIKLIQLIQGVVFR